MASSFERCMAAMGEALGRRLSWDEAEAFAERLENERVRLRAEGYADDPLTAARGIAEEIAAEKAVAQRNVILNRTAWRSMNAFADGVGDPSLALQALRVGVNTPVPGGRLSVDATGKAMFSESLGGLLASLRRMTAEHGLDHFKLFLSRDYEIEIAKALRGEAAPVEAQRIARAIDTFREQRRQRENRAGSWRGRLEGYVSRQTHNSLAVRRAGYEAWRDMILPLLDEERTFARDRDRKLALRAERDAVANQALATETDMKNLRQHLRLLSRRAKKAEGKAATAERRETTLEGQVAEAYGAMHDALAQYMDRYERATVARGTGGQGAPLQGIGRESVTSANARLVESRVALTRARRRLAELRDQHARRTADAGLKREAADEAAGLLDDAMDASERIERGLDLLHELHDRLGEYETRLRDPVEDRERYLRAVYNKIVTNVWMKGAGPEFDGIASMIGSASVGKRRSTHRELHFRDAASELAYARKFGQGGLAENIAGEFETSARATALMEAFGPNAAANHDRFIVEKLRRAQETGDWRTARQLQRRFHANEFAEIDGTTRQAVNPTLAHWASAWRAIQSMAKLGMATISSFGDIATVAAELRYQGVGILDSYRGAWGGVLKGVRRGERREFADLAGVGFDALAGLIQSRYASTDTAPGWISKSVQRFFRWNLLNWWSDTHKTTAGLMTARHFADMARHAWDALPDAPRKVLAQYGIDAPRWELLRAHGVRAAEDGTTFMLPDGIRAIPLGEFYALATDRNTDVVPAERWLHEARDRLATAYQTLIVDRTDFAVPTPGARERAIMNQGTPRGTVLGESLRFVMQFKGFPIAMMTKTIGRELNGGPITASAVARMGFLMAELTAMGYLSMLAKDLLRGKEPRDPIDKKTILAAMTQGGGFGLYGDFVFGEYSRFGRSATASLAGPTFGQLDDVMEVFHGWKKGDGKAMAASRLLVSNTPFLSHFMARPAFDQLVLYPWYESLSPGFTHRLVARTERDEGRGYFRDPREAVR